MLTKLTTEQVSAYWDLLLPGIKEVLREAGDNPEQVSSSILQGLLEGSLACWLEHNSDGPPRGFVITDILYDRMSGESNLLIYILYSFEVVTPEELSSGLGVLRDYARKVGCRSIYSYVYNPGVLALLKRYGANVSCTFAKLEVDHG